jgi:uncharacterized RDD family membrane protein YckC
MDSPNPYAPPGAEVQDIYDPTVTLEMADRGTRLGAAILDGIIVMAMVYGPFLVGLIIATGMGSSDGPNTGVLVGSVILACIGLVIWCWLTIRDVARNGQTIAKKMLGIRVVRADGSPATLGRIFWLRNVVNFLISLVPFYSIVDVLFIFAEDRQCLHDKLADTIVVKA